MTTFRAVSLALLLGASAAPAAGADQYKGLGEAIARAAADNAVKRVAVQSFETRGGAGRNEGAYVAEQVSAALSGTKKIFLVERELLEGVLKETRLSLAANGAPAADEIFTVDAVVTGVVFPDGDSLKFFVKLVEVRTGRVLLARAAETLRLGGSFMETMSEALGLPDVPMPRAEDMRIFEPPPPDLRDTPAEPPPGSCAARRALLTRLNEELLSDKALYWAGRLREPGFSLSGLRSNPGSEISDPALRRDFYRLLARFYAEGRTAGPDGGRRGRLDRLLRLEEATAAECGGGA